MIPQCSKVSTQDEPKLPKSTHRCQQEREEQKKTLRMQNTYRRRNFFCHPNGISHYTTFKFQKTMQNVIAENDIYSKQVPILAGC